MNDTIEVVKLSALTELAASDSIQALDQFRIKFLARKGQIAALFDALKDVPSADRPQVGKTLNEMKRHVEAQFEEKKNLIEQGTAKKSSQIDLTLPGLRPWVGSKHPLTQTLDEIKRIFIAMGFRVENGPEIEDDYHNFEALNFPPDHPARDMQDTFFISEKVLLRTHTSPVQIRLMESEQPPIRALIPGRVYRNEAISSRSYCLFHQVEGLYIDKNVTFAELKGTLVSFANLR